jgi:hypothetical protein
MRIKKPHPVSDVEKTTNAFYRRFKEEHSEFLRYVQGIADQCDRERYALLMLNRLLFLAFIQQRGFLAGDRNYLRNRLRQVQEQHMQDPFCSFYRYFLLTLFYEGLNKRERSPVLERLLGDVPYLNCDLFAIDALERKYPAIQIPDCAFARLLDFFQEYDWHLDDDLDTTEKGQVQDLPRQAPFRSGVSPDMLGSIFERFINQKEKGAYYTKDDVTEYISKNTIIPSIFDAVEKRCPDAFYPTGPVWSVLGSNYDDYLNADVLKEETDGDLRTADPDLRRMAQGKHRALSLRQPIELSPVEPAPLCIHDFITYNLDICKFARNVIASCERADLLLAFYESIEATTILDPTCGAGAFLFAALRILYPLYEACLVRMHAMVNEQALCAGHIEPQERHQSYQIERLRAILQRVGKGVARLRYFILKSIVVKNLYGVDLMEEAVEMCKLRLFLKLIAQVDRPEGCGEGDSSPALSAISFNVFVGNALVGSASLDEACQTTVISRLGADVRLASTSPRPALAHQPFHWCTEFRRVMKSGGFSVIIGNPPYVEYNAAKFPYTLQHFKTLACANLYPCVVERSHQLLSPRGYHGMILPLAAFATKNMIPFIEGFYQWFPRSWVSFYHFRPAMLFSGGKVASIPTAIFLANATGPEQRFSTNLIKWSTDKRDQLFSHLMYCPVTVARDVENRHYYPKFGDCIENTIMEKILRHQRIERCLVRTPNQNTMWYRSAGGLYWKVFVNFPWPYETTSNKQCSFQQGYERDVFVALFNSSLFWWYYTVTFDTFNLKDYMLFGFRFSYPEDPTLVHALCLCCQRLMNDFCVNAQHLKRGKTASYTVYARKSKHIIDAIDRLLARHYGFTDDELDFIINYDIKYRMGYDRARILE